MSGSLPGLSRTLKTFSSLSSSPLVCKWRRKCVSDARVLCRFTHVSVCVCVFLVRGVSLQLYWGQVGKYRSFQALST